jgi:hypothetical protein
VASGSEHLFSFPHDLHCVLSLQSAFVPIFLPAAKKPTRAAIETSSDILKKVLMNSLLFII